MFLFKKKNTKKELDSRIQEKIEIIEESKNKALIEDRFSSYEFDIVKDMMRRVEELNDYEKYTFFTNIVESLEKNNNLSTKDGETINNLINDPDSVIAIHRTYIGPIEKLYGVPTNSNLSDIMEEGLINNGHAMQGAYTKYPSLTLTTSPLTSFGDLINLFGSYKDNNTTIILRFPKTLVTKKLDFNIEKPEEIYNIKDGISYIKPEYIVGAIVKEQDKDRLFTREELLNNKNIKRV